MMGELVLNKIEGKEFFRFNSSMNNQRLHHTNSYIRVRKERTENMALNK